MPATSRRSSSKPPTARLEDLTVDYRELPDASHPDNILIHHFSIGSRASRIAYALPDRMVLVYHNITPPEYFIDVHPLLVQQCFLGRRELGFYRVALRSGARRFRVQPAGARSSRLSAALPCCPWFPTSRIWPDRPDYRQAGAFDDDWVNLLFVGRVIPNKRIEDVDPLVSRIQEVVQPAIAVAARRLAWRLRTLCGDAAPVHRTASARPTCT